MKDFLLILPMTLILLTACQSRGAPDIKALEVLSDFAYVGSGAATFLSNGELDDTYVVPHGKSELLPPKSLKIGIQYVFHYGGMLNNETLGCKELPLRLNKLKLNIIKAPESPFDFGYPAFSDPMFIIIFSDGKHTGMIYNRPGGKHEDDRQFRNEDYVLIFLH